MWSLFFQLSGIFSVLYLAWPEIVIAKNWKCFNDIIAKSAEDKVSLKAVMEVLPSYLNKGKNKKMSSKLRIVADACFR